MIVAVASRNPNKLRAVEAAYRMFGIRASAVAVDRPPGLPQQPVGLGEVVRGAVERARRALSAVRGAVHGVGIEAGAVEAGGAYLDVTVAAVADASGLVTLGLGPGFQVPSVFLGGVLSGVELGALAESFFGRPAVGYREGLVGLLSGGRVTRLDLNAAAVAMALLPRLPRNSRLYGWTATPNALQKA
ncbi:MAG: inosine/xanthosine triphosphatase [Thermoproteus sp.]